MALSNNDDYLSTIVNEINFELMNIIGCSNRKAYEFLMNLFHVKYGFVEGRDRIFYILCCLS